MNVYTLCGFAVCAASAISLIRSMRPELAPAASALSGVVLLSFLLAELAPFIEFIRSVASEQGLDGYFALMLKALAISVCCKITSEICKGCGEGTLSSQVELAGKAGILLISLPIIKELLEIAKDML